MQLKSFREFGQLTEAKTTKKVFISHLDKMPPLEFLSLVSELDKKYKGILSRDKISITEKIDGMVLRIGQDKDGKSFIESSAQGSIYKVGDFTVRDKSRGGSGEMGRKFDLLLKLFKADKKVQGVLSKMNNGNGIKIIGEILHTPLGITELDTIKFVRIAYERAKLGEEWTFIPFKVIDDDGNQYHNTEEVKKALYAISDSKRKYVPPTLNISRDIDISIEISKFKDDILTKYKDLPTLLASRKHADREMKAAITAEIAEYQKQIAKKVISYVNGGLFGNQFEGIVIELPNGTIVKVISDSFKNAPKPEFIQPPKK